MAGYGSDPLSQSRKLGPGGRMEDWKCLIICLWLANYSGIPGTRVESGWHYYWLGCTEKNIVKEWNMQSVQKVVQMTDLIESFPFIIYLYNLEKHSMS